MLAPCFKTAEELGLDEWQRAALIKVLGRLERGELHEVDEDGPLPLIRHEPDVFSMRSWSTCICGHAKRYAEFTDDVVSQSGPIGSLFYRTSMNMTQATLALRDYLTGINPCRSTSTI
jgi:hypothetical protein